MNRRELLQKGMAGLGIAGLSGTIMAPSLFSQAAQAAAVARANDKILVILELSGGNDGLNTVVPYGDDAYYRHRPNIGLPKDDLRILDDHFGLNGGMSGFERLYKDGKMAALCSSAMGLSDRRGIIYGDNGFIEVENINNCEGIRVYDRSRNMIASYDTPKQISGYEYEVEACLRAIKEGALECPEMPHEETLRMMGWMDELRRQWGLVYPMER